MHRAHLHTLGLAFGGLTLAATAPTSAATNNPTPTSIGSSPANGHSADSTGRRPAASADTVRADTVRNH